MPTDNEAPAKAGSMSRGNVAVAIVTSAIFLLYLAWRTQTWVVAVAILIGLVVHESGHALAQIRAGCGPVRMVFIPFLGGLAIQSKPSPTQFIDVLIALAGPALGITMVLPLIGAAFVTGDPAWLLGAFFVTILNIYNLFPAPPLDGSHAIGPVLANIHPMLERVVVVVLGLVAAVWSLTGGSFLVALLIGMATFNAARFGVKRAESLPLKGSEPLLAVVLYLAVLGLCFLALFFVSLTLGEPNPFVLLKMVLGIG
jgi:Zn-dependent protease